jgi:hypothetical protein
MFQQFTDSGRSEPSALFMFSESLDHEGLSIDDQIIVFVPGIPS